MEAMPKSAILMFLSASSSRFSGFKSRWLRSNISDYFGMAIWGFVPYHVAVAIVDTTDQLREKDKRFREFQTAFLHQIIKKFASFYVFKYKEPARRVESAQNAKSGESTYKYFVVSYTSYSFSTLV